MEQNKCPTKGLLKIINAFLGDRKAQNLRPTTIVFYRKRLLKFEGWCTDKGINDVFDLTPEMIREFMVYLQDCGHNPGGQHSYYRTIKTFLNFFEAEYEPEGWKNPIRKIKPPRVDNDPLDGVTKEEFDVLFNSCGNGTFTSERNKALLSILLDTGARIGEIIALNIGDIDFDTSSILIRRSKTRKPRDIFIGKQTRRQVRKYMKYMNNMDTGALFVTDEGSRLTYSGMRQIMRRLANKAGTETPGFHDFRRGFAQGQLKNKVDVSTISKLLGHASIATTARYLAQKFDDMQVAYKSILDGE